MNETTSNVNTERPRRPKRDAAYYQRAAKQYHNALLIFVSVIVILIFAVANLITRDRDVSESENRKLAQKPAFSVDAMLDGSYFRDLNAWYNDQFVGRDGWISWNLTGQKLIGRRESGDVYLGKKGYLLSKPDVMDEDAMAAKTASIREFASAYPDVRMYMTIVPSAATILTDKLPRNAPVPDQLGDIVTVSARLGAVQFVDVASTLQNHSDEYIFYKTDHHWTSLGARYAFEALTSYMNIMTPVTEYDIHTVSKRFEGTLASESGSHKSRDTIEVYTPQTDVNYYVSYPDTQEKTASMYNRACLDVKDQYTVFFGGNHPLVELYTTANTGKVLMLFKDSYANCFVQFLTPYYDKIIMIDPRYYYDDLTAVITTEGVTDVLFLYSADQFMTDTSLTDVMNSALTTLNTTQEPPETEP